MNEKINQLKRGLSGRGTKLILPATAALVLVSEFLVGSGGCIEINPGEVGVIYNNTGLSLFGDEAETIVDQGLKTFLPGLQHFEKLDRRPQALIMAEGTVDARERQSSFQQVRPLTVRAKDGSNFYFDKLEIHYQLMPAQAKTVILRLGPGEIYKERLLSTYSRGVLRDEFGRFSFLEIADPTTYGAATSESKSRLNKLLETYGIEVLQIVTPKPKFDPAVEHAIEERQNAEQEIEVQAEKRNKLDQESKLKVQNIEQQKSAEYQTLLADLEARKKAAENKLLSTRREADIYFIEREAAGGAYRDEKITRAKANEVAYRKEAEGMVAKIQAVGAQGPDVLNSVIAEEVFPQLKNISASPMVAPAGTIDLRYITEKKGAN